jgi:hypothetical protein
LTRAQGIGAQAVATKTWIRKKVRNNRTEVLEWIRAGRMLASTKTSGWLCPPEPDPACAQLPSSSHERNV